MLLRHEEELHAAFHLHIPLHKGRDMSEKRIVVLTGAGISAESGVRTFRDGDGLWEEHRIEDVATPQAWRADPMFVWRFYQARRRQLLDVKPNPAHFALAEMAQNREHFTLITQNVDDLHERAGSSNTIHMHGRLETLRCERSGRNEVRMDENELLDEFLTCSCCSEPVRLRPDIVWFGETPMFMNEIYAAVEQCDVFVVVGSSGHVYPAANLVNIAKAAGATTILVNLEAPLNVDAFDEVHLGKAGVLLPDLLKRLA